ncbi:hybrid sensor histidine kinase/response regulator [Fibrobacter succinogenes]|uniref:hybrid sensor histidine kinase/response regulator n=1 Tax=Fibrobacter succinogenes TaxID=833 RepID=UPI0013D1E3C2|nr:response regulator [Fibrobacter succinogenes]
MELTPRTAKINIKMVVWLASVVFVLCLVCVLLRVKLDALLNVYVTKQVSQQAVLIANLVNEKLQVHLNALSMISRKIEADGSRVEDFLALSDVKNENSSYGLITLDGTAYTGSSQFVFPDESYRCVMESFRGNKSVCYSEKMGILLGVPVFNRHNVRFVLYMQYDEIPINNFFDVDCFEKKCFAQVIDNDGRVLIQNNTGAWRQDSVWNDADVAKIYSWLRQDMDRGGLATARSVQIGNETYYFYMAKLLQDDFMLAGMVAGEDVSDGLDQLSFLVFWVVGFLMLLFLTGLGIRFFLVHKNRELHLKSHLVSDELDRLRMMESVGQDIRNPAMNVLNMGAIVLRESGDSSLKEYVSEMRASGQELLLLSNDILDMNKIRTNSLEITIKEYDLFAVLCDCYSAARSRKKSAEFELLVDSSIPVQLEGDESRLWQVISNILFNAERLVVNSANIIQIGYRWAEDENGVESTQKIDLIIDVPDAGVSWTGASLTLVKMLVGALGGSIKSSHIADGLPVVEIVIPQKVVKNELMGDFKTRYNEFVHASENKSIHFYAPNASILAIDDVPMNLRVMSGLMKETFARFDPVSNGMEAIEKFRRNHYDLIFLDHTMPIVDGLDILTIMKTLDDHPNQHTPIVMLTADDGTTAKTICETAGFADFLTKPVHEDALFTILLKFLPKELINHYDELPKKEEIVEPAPVEEKPAKKVMLIQEPKKPSENLPSDVLNVSVGLFCCERNEALYRKKMMVYVEKQYDAVLSKLFKDEDFESYRLMVQMLKSASLYIGAVEIASIAKAMEFACNEGDYDYVRVRHADLMCEYKRIVKAIKERVMDGRAN